MLKKQYYEIFSNLRIIDGNNLSGSEASFRVSFGNEPFRNRNSIVETQL